MPVLLLRNVVNRDLCRPSTDVVVAVVARVNDDKLAFIGVTRISHVQPTWSGTPAMPVAATANAKLCLNVVQSVASLVGTVCYASLRPASCRPTTRRRGPVHPRAAHN